MCVGWCGMLVLVRCLGRVWVSLLWLVVCGLVIGWVWLCGVVWFSCGILLVVIFAVRLCVNFGLCGFFQFRW